MRICFAGLILGLALTVPVVSSAQDATTTDQKPDATLQISQYALNRIVNKLGMLSDFGVSQPMHAADLPGIGRCQPVGNLYCPGSSEMDSVFEGNRIVVVGCETEDGGVSVFPQLPPVFWAWWVTGANFTLIEGSMAFTAEVRHRAGDAEDTEQRTVSASVYFDSSNNRLAIRIDDFKVPLLYRGGTVTEVDVARLYSLSIPIVPQTFIAPKLDGTTKTLTGRVLSIHPRYEEGKILVNIDVGFENE